MDKKVNSSLQAPAVTSWQKPASVLPGSQKNVVQAQCCKPGACQPKQ